MVAVPVGEIPELPPSVITTLRQACRDKVSDKAWDFVALKMVSLFEGYKRRNQ